MEPRKREARRGRNWDRFLCSISFIFASQLVLTQKEIIEIFVSISLTNLLHLSLLAACAVLKTRK